MENPTDYPRVLERFPDWSDLIQQRTQSDADFEEICSDYEQLAKWLEDHCHDGSTQESTLLDNRQLLAELEIELVQFLQAVEHQHRCLD